MGSLHLDAPQDGSGADVVRYARPVMRPVWLLALLVACRGQPTAPGNGAGAIVAKLTEHAEGAALLERAPAHRVVFAPEAGLTPTGTVRLVADEPVASSAARYGHLLHHLVHGRPFDDVADGDCAKRLETARRREKSALALEHRLRASFGVAPLPDTALEARVNAYRNRCR